MIKIENIEVTGWEAAIRGMRNPMNSWDKSDSVFVENGERHDICGKNLTPANISPEDCETYYRIGDRDEYLMMKLAENGTVHAKYRRMIVVYMDITAPLYWWKEFDTYKVGTVANSCSTMHKIHEKRFEREDFSIEHIENCNEHHWMVCMDNVISSLNVARDKYLKTKDKKYWWQMIQILPSSYEQKRTVMINYEVLANIYHNRKDHKLDEWREFCECIRDLPYGNIITLEPENYYFGERRK